MIGLVVVLVVVLAWVALAVAVRIGWIIGRHSDWWPW